MSGLSKQCVNCGTTHDLGHLGPCVSCCEEDWRTWCVVHSRVAGVGGCPDCTKASPKPPRQRAIPTAPKFEPILGGTYASGRPPVLPSPKPPPTPTFTFHCGFCGQTCAAPPAAAGRRVSCRKCGSVSRVSPDLKGSVLESTPSRTLGTTGSDLRVSKLAVASAIVGVLSLLIPCFGLLGVVAFFMGCGAFDQIHRISPVAVAPTKGSGWAVTGIVCGALSAVLGCVSVFGWMLGR